MEQLVLLNIELLAKLFPVCLALQHRYCGFGVDFSVKLMLIRVSQVFKRDAQVGKFKVEPVLFEFAIFGGVRVIDGGFGLEG